MAWIYEFDGINIVRFRAKGGERTIFAPNWYHIKAMTLHKDRLIIAADTSIYSMSTQDASFITIAQYWNGIRTLLSDGEDLLILADGGWYSMRVTDGSYLHLYNFQPDFAAVAAIQTAASHQPFVQQGIPAQPVQGMQGMGGSRFSVGARVASRWSDNFYYMATIQQVLGGGQYKIIYDDGTASTAQENQFIPVIQPITAYIGQPVLAVWQKAGRLYEAQIGDIRSNFAIVIWDDGGTTNEVAWSEIVPRR